MKKRQQVLIPIALISMMLISQMAALAHSVEHSFHKASHSCTVFVQCEKSSNGLVSAIRIPAVPLLSKTHVDGIPTQQVPLLKTAYFARAPPFTFL
ncbi:MAG: hypothetical protein ACJA2Y_000205 [Cycloclasticus pugetii]|jgi:hypothetical protein|uniref:DUF2607 family protein n=1 Tax=Cycloclasticus pugetii TaxID=34068 RepID=UPI0039E50B8F